MAGKEWEFNEEGKWEGIAKKRKEGKEREEKKEMGKASCLLRDRRPWEERLKVYEKTCSLFSFLHELESMDFNEIEAAAAKLVAEYKEDLDETLAVELVQFLQPSSFISWKMTIIR